MSRHSVAGAYACEGEVTDPRAAPAMLGYSPAILGWSATSPYSTTRPLADTRLPAYTSPAGPFSAGRHLALSRHLAHILLGSFAHSVELIRVNPFSAGRHLAHILLGLHS